MKEEQKKTRLKQYSEGGCIWVKHPKENLYTSYIKYKIRKNYQEAPPNRGLPPKLIKRNTKNKIKPSHSNINKSCP